MRSNTDTSTSARWRACATAGLVAALLAVTGCTGGGETADETSAPTSEPSVSSAAPNEEQSQGANDEVDGASASPYGDGHGSGDGQGDGASDDNGEYVPASEDGPAKNVPVPTKPSMMAYDNPEGAKAAAAYFWDTVNYMDETGDDSYMLEITGDECTTCHAFASLVAVSEERGGWSTGTNVEVDTAIVSPNHSTGEGWVINQLLNSDAGTEYWWDGDDIMTEETDPMVKHPWEVRVRWVPDTSEWSVDYVNVMRASQ